MLPLARPGAPSNTTGSGRRGKSVWGHVLVTALRLVGSLTSRAMPSR